MTSSIVVTCLVWELPMFRMELVTILFSFILLTHLVRQILTNHRQIRCPFRHEDRERDTFSEVSQTTKAAESIRFIHCTQIILEKFDSSVCIVYLWSIFYFLDISLLAIYYHDDIHIWYSWRNYLFFIAFQREINVLFITR